MIGGLLNTAVPILITLIVIFVIYAAFQFARTSDAGKRNEFRNQLIAGIIALAVVFSIFGLVRILQNTVFGGPIGNTATGAGLFVPDLNQ